MVAPKLLNIQFERHRVLFQLLVNTTPPGQPFALCKSIEPLHHQDTRLVMGGLMFKSRSGQTFFQTFIQRKYDYLG